MENKKVNLQELDMLFKIVMDRIPPQEDIRQEVTKVYIVDLVGHAIDIYKRVCRMYDEDYDDDNATDRIKQHVMDGIDDLV